MENKNYFLEKIRRNIKDFGFHIYLIFGGAVPRFAYTIGLSQSFGAELVFAGGSFFSIEDVDQIFKGVVKKIEGRNSLIKLSIEIERLGRFKFQKVDNSWADTMLLGAQDYYQVSQIPSLQIFPDHNHWTIDIPDLSRPWCAESEPVWKLLGKNWNHSFPEQSVAVTNLDALQGKPITEAVRWEENEWELFAGDGPDVQKEDIRKVPLGTLLAWDETLEPVINLNVQDGLWRNSKDSKWQKWQRRK